MKEYLLILLNERSRTDFIDDLQLLISKSSGLSVLLYFTPKNPTVEVAIPFPFRSYHAPYAGNIPVINKEQSLDSLKISIVVNLSGHEILDDRLRDLPEVTSQFFDQLYMDYCPAIINSILQQKGSCEFQVTLKEKGNSFFELTNGAFKVLPYDYKKTLQLFLTGNIHLVADGILRYIHHQKGNSIQKPSGIEPLDMGQFHLYKRHHHQSKFKHRFNTLFMHDKWNVGIIDAPLEEVALQKNKKWDVKWLSEYKNFDFAADPFGCEIDGHKIIFFEKYVQRKGTIESKKNNEAAEKSLVLPIHLSYPYTIQHNNKWYCIPEQHQSNSVKLYQINPQGFELEHPIEILSGFSAVDPSLIHKEGKWYLFCTDATDKGADVRLNIFIASDLEGPYLAHAKNPVKTDIRSARCAGKIFFNDGHYYRPAQDSSHTYGGEISIQRIDVLTENEYSETEINRINPSSLKGIYQKGCHTLSALGSSTLIDGKRNVFSIRNLFQIFRKK